MRILVVEDNERMATVVATALKRETHTIRPARTAEEAEKALVSEHFDVAIVDVGLPDRSGLDLCRSLRAEGVDVPILVLTARTDVGDRVKGLDAGADDYLGKPFATAELVARVRALGRRGPRWTDAVRHYGDIVIDRDRRTVRAASRTLALTPREFEIVALVAWAEGRVLSRADVLVSLWGDENEANAASFEVLLTRIRRKLAEAGAPNAIRTIRNVGYAWELARSKPV
jgi:two-component system OmpR family response regulator